MKRVSTHSSNASSRVVIIGGGIAGLSAAIALSKVRRDNDPSPVFDVVLVEARRGTGGRAGSFIDPASDETTDYCQHVVMGCCTNFLDLMTQSGLSDCLTRYRELNFYHPSRGFSPFRPRSFWPAPLHLNPALAGLKHLSRKEKLRIRVGLWRLMRTSESTLQGVRAATWLAEQGQDAGVRSRFWDVILVSALGDTPEHVSMAAARQVMIDGFMAAPPACEVWVPNVPLSHLLGDRMNVVLKQQGVKLRAQSLVKQLHCPDHSSPLAQARVLLADGTSIESDHVVLATSWRAASRLIQTLDLGSYPSEVRQWQREVTETIGSISPSPITGVHLWLDRILTPLPHVVMVGGIAHWLFRQPIQPPGPEPERGHYHQVVISARHRLSDASQEQLVEHVMSELRTAFPAARDAVVLHSRVVTDPSAVYSVNPEFESRRPTCGTALPWLHLAGDYVKTGWPATMEGATISGRLAADRVLSKLGEEFGEEASGSCVTPGLRPGRFASLLIK